MYVTKAPFGPCMLIYLYIHEEYIKILISNPKHPKEDGEHK
jgi:hypothetical protein